MAEDPIDIRAFREDDLESIVEFSLRAWRPIFASVREVLGDDIFLRLHADWRADQAAAIRATCANSDRDVFVATANGRPVGFVAVALNAFHERMGAIDIVGVDPDYQRRGISSGLTEFAKQHMRSRGMDIAVVETGGDPRSRTCASCLRDGRFHAPTHCSVLPGTRLRGDHWSRVKRWARGTRRHRDQQLRAAADQHLLDAFAGAGGFLALPLGRRRSCSA